MPVADDWSPEDVEHELKDSEPELLKYFGLLPKALWGKHLASLQVLTEEHRSEPKEVIAERRINYILGIIDARESALVESNTYDQKVKETLLNSKDRIDDLGKSLREVLITQGNMLGYGQTARVKSMHLNGSEEPIAIKYLLTPTPKTLSADGEHEMLHEVETLVHIEDSKERFGNFDHIGVPHPCFYYKRGKLECYGMSQIDGVTLQEVLNGDGGYHEARDAALQAINMRYASEEEKKSLETEIDTFMRRVHEACLHGDINPKNIMVDITGKFYLIDFGQSVPMRTMLDKTRDQFENLQDEERSQMHICIGEALRRAQKESPVS